MHNSSLVLASDLFHPEFPVASLPQVGVRLVRITTCLAVVGKYAWCYLQIRLTTSYYPDVNNRSDWWTKSTVVADVCSIWAFSLINRVENFTFLGSGFHGIGRTSLLKILSSPFPVPHKYRLYPHLTSLAGTRTLFPHTSGHRDRDAHFQNMQHTTHKSRWIHTTGQKYGDEPRHFTPPRGRCDHHSPAFLNSQAESAYVSICKHSHESLLRYLATTSFPHQGWWHVSLGSFKRVKTNGKQLKKYQSAPKTGNQNVQPVRFWY